MQKSRENAASGELIDLSSIKCFSITFAPSDTAVTAVILLRVWSESPVIQLKSSLIFFIIKRFASSTGAG